jgi:4'-phosphopantetheinyl transferase
VGFDSGAGPMVSHINANGDPNSALWRTIAQGSQWPFLEPNDIHLLRAKFPPPPVSPILIDRMSRMLSADERARADRLSRASTTEHGLLGRGLLRLCLSNYLSQFSDHSVADYLPHAIEFSVGVGGKPSLRSGDHVAFNVSHSGDWIVIAVTRDQAIGVDIEQLRSPFATDALAKRYFAPSEVEQLAALPDDKRTIGFFNAWTRKEAYVKARGAGLQLGLNGFAVTLRPDEPGMFVSGVEEKWRLLSFSVASDLPGALVFERQASTLRQYDVSSCFDADVSLKTD